MKKSFLIVAAAIFALVSCNKNESPFVGEDPNEQGNAFLQTDYNLNMRNFALAVNEAINTNKSFRIFIKEEVNKMFDGDYEVLLSNIVDSKVENYETDGNGIVTRAGGNISVRDLLNSSFRKVQEKAIAKGDYSFSEQSRAPANQLIDQLTEQYPDLQIAVPFLTEQLEDENYIPTVVFLPEEYDEQNTKYLPAIKKDSSYNILAHVFPDSACVVISMNERVPLVTTATYEDVVPPTPTNLQLSESENGIKLMWNMPTGTNSSNTLGYKIYRAVGSSNFGTQPYAAVLGYMNTTFTDEIVTNNVTYSYRVSAYNNSKESDLCDIKSIMPLRPAAAKTFSVEQEALNSVRLRWTFAQNEYSGNVNINKRQYNVFFGPTTSFVASVPVSNDYYIHSNVVPGVKVEYQIERTSAFGPSIPSYDFIYTPYRDMNNFSKVYIRRIKYSDISKIESWWKGKPEFDIKVFGVSGSTTTEIASFTNIELSSREDNKWTVVKNSQGTVTHYWKPGKTQWYDAFTFYVIEKDGGLWETIYLVGKKVMKVIADSTKNTWDNQILKEVDVLDKEITGFLQGNDEKIGYAYLNYYDYPFREYQMASAECGGY